MFQRILLATDGSAASEHAGQLAVSLASTHGATLTALYVVDPYPYLGIGELNPSGFNAYMSVAREHAAQAHARIEEIARQQQPPVSLEVRVVEDVTAVDGVLETARTLGSDLIVVGSHGRTGIRRLMLGSVATRIVAESKVPVLVVR